MEFIALNKKDFAIGEIDYCDLDLIDGLNVNLMDTGYARIGRRKLHTLILERKLGRGIASGCVSDHINRNRLDNRRSNLREASISQNNSNRSINLNSWRKHSGSRFIKRLNKWQAQIKINGKQRYLGLFKSEMEAEIRYKEECKVVGYL